MDILERAERHFTHSTPAGWSWKENAHGYIDRLENEDGIVVIKILGPQPNALVVNPADAELIAEAPELILELAAEVYRLRKIVGENHEALKFIPNDIDIASLVRNKIVSIHNRFEVTDE